MSKRDMITVDGNEACASVAYRLSEIAAIYPITPSSTMGELADQWSSDGLRNIWGSVPDIIEMQHEGGAAGAVHGAATGGTLATTFTASQGLLLMIPNMYKLAGELTPFTMHVSARTIATHALSIFGDHSDVMACRQTGFALLASGSVQEAHDLAAIAHTASLRSRIPFLHFFDGFRTSHEIANIHPLSDHQLRSIVDEDSLTAHRRRALSPDHPSLHGSAQNPDTFFQAQESRNGWYQSCPDLVQQQMDRLARLCGRTYHLFDYYGSPDAERVLVLMGSGAETARMTAHYLNQTGAQVGVVQVRLYRPFSVSAFAAALPPTVRAIAVLDRCKEPGAPGEPLYLDVLTALYQAHQRGLVQTIPTVIGGRYGLASKEFTPSMVKAIYDHLAHPSPHHSFTVGITDDVTHQSLPLDPHFTLPHTTETRALFYGLGSDGTVGANKNSIKIICDQAGLYGQGYFVYDSKKSGAVTISHLRFSPAPIHQPYLLDAADFIACHHFVFLDRYDVLEHAAHGATLLLNSPYDADQVWDHLPQEVQQQIRQRHIRLFVIDAQKVAQHVGMGQRINTIMQTCFFALSGVLPREQAIHHIKRAIEKSYGRKSAKVVTRNFSAVDQALSFLQPVTIPDSVTSSHCRPPVVPDDAPDFVQHVTALMLGNKGDMLPVSAFPPDGVWPTGTARFERRNIAQHLPQWDPTLCIQCNKCTMVCPHAAIRAKLATSDQIAAAPSSLLHMPYGGSDFKNQQYVLQVAPDDCTGCSLCVHVCPGKDKADPTRLALHMVPKPEIQPQQRQNWEFFRQLPELDRALLPKPSAKTAQFLQPLFEFSGACLGCGETPYLKLLTQLYGDRLLIANATGCSSIFGGNLPTTPYAQDQCGRGPAWANSLFEDNAEFGLGLRLAVEQQQSYARQLLEELVQHGDIQAPLADALLYAPQHDETHISQQRQRVEQLKQLLQGKRSHAAQRLREIADHLVDKVVWIVGGDGWAYDIGYGGLDHVLASGRNVNILVLDTEVYSNTGGQQSKATPLGATAKFAAAGKSRPKKDLGLMAIAYEQVYVASIAFGAKDVQTLRALQDAVSYPGVSLIIAYSHCIAHGYDLSQGLEQQKRAVQTGYWPLYRWDPRKLGTDQSALTVDSGEPTADLQEFIQGESRFTMVEQAHPDRFHELMQQANLSMKRRFDLLKRLAAPPG